MSVALDVLLTRVLAFNTPVMKIGLGFVAIAVCGAVYGPVAGAICGALGDIIGSLLFPTGAYFPGFTLTAALTGLIFGLLLKPFSRPKAAAAGGTNSVLVSFLANTYMISYISGSPFSKLLTTRAVQLAVMVPLQICCLMFAVPAILKAVEKIRSKDENRQ